MKKFIVVEVAVPVVELVVEVSVVELATLLPVSTLTVVVESVVGSKV